MRTSTVGTWSLIALLAASPALAGEAAGRQSWTFNFIFENDSTFNMSDRHYTGGNYFSATSGARAQCETCASLARWLMLGADSSLPATYRYGFFIGQNIYTPIDLSLEVPTPDDRPYAGWLYAGARLSRESGNVLDQFEVVLGVVGPSSGAEAVQRWWHAWHGSTTPHGWDSQLKDEIGLVLSGQRIWRQPLSLGLAESDVLPQINVTAGNIFTYAGAGATIRFGRRLGVDWGPPRVRPALTGSDFIDTAAGPSAWYVFAGVEGRAVLRNIFLDGNTFQQSANVDKENFVGDLTGGFAVVSERAAFRASYTQRTKEFKTQHNMDHVFSFAFSLMR